MDSGLEMDRKALVCLDLRKKDFLLEDGIVALDLFERTHTALAGAAVSGQMGGVSGQLGGVSGQLEVCGEGPNVGDQRASLLLSSRLISHSWP